MAQIQLYNFQIYHLANIKLIDLLLLSNASFAAYGISQKRNTKSAEEYPKNRSMK